jgi:hypothetical protein
MRESGQQEPLFSGQRGVAAESFSGILLALWTVGNGMRNCKIKKEKHGPEKGLASGLEGHTIRGQWQKI